MCSPAADGQPAVLERPHRLTGRFGLHRTLNQVLVYSDGRESNRLRQTRPQK